MDGFGYVGLDKSHIQPLCTKWLKKCKSSNPADSWGKNDENDNYAKVVSDNSKKKVARGYFGIEFRNNDTLKSYIQPLCSKWLKESKSLAQPRRQGSVREKWWQRP